MGTVPLSRRQEARGRSGIALDRPRRDHYKESGTVTTLIFNVPGAKAHLDGYLDFAATVAGGVGKGYAIPKAGADRLAPGDKVVVLDKDRERRAEGTLVKLVADGKAGNG